MVKVRVRIVSYADSCDTAVSDLSEVEEPDRLAGARPWPQRPPRSFPPLGGGSDPPCWRLPFTSRSSVSVSPPSTRKRRAGRSNSIRSMGVRTHLSANICGHTTSRGQHTVTHQSERAHQTSHWRGLCRKLHTYFAEFSFHDVRA